jgi:hypothetical protein
MTTADHNSVAQLLHDGEAAFDEVQKVLKHARQSRAQGMITAVRAGWSLRDIADELGMSFPRVQQIINSELDRQNTIAALSNLPRSGD